MNTHHASLEEELLAHITGLPVIDTHEHMTMEADFINGSYDFTDMMNYVGLDLGLAGFPAGPWGGAQGAVRRGGDVAEKWRRIEPFWPYVRTGVYGRAYRRMLRIFFGVDDLDESNAHLVTERIRDYQRPGVYDEWLHKRYGIRVMLEPCGNPPVPELDHFAPELYIDDLGGPFSADMARGAVRSELPSEPREFLDMVRGRVETAATNGAIGLKIGMGARLRPLDFREHTDEQVRESYTFLINEANGDWTSESNRTRLKPIQDAAYWAAFEKAGELGLPVHVHTGLEFMQQWDGRPTALIPTLIRFPETKFAIFHGSYPHMADLTGLAKSFHNVYVDLAWFHLLSRRQARIWLAEWLDVLPHNKIFAFGGDVFLFFGICSHLEFARENVAAVLAERVANGLCDLDEAKHTARLLLHDNAWNTFAFGNWERVKSQG